MTEGGEYFQKRLYFPRNSETKI